MSKIHSAAYEGDMAFILSELEKGTSVNTKNSAGKTLLHEAVTGGHEELIKMLLEKKASINEKENLGNTPLHNAVGNKKVIELLLGHKKIDLNVKNDKGETPLNNLCRSKLACINITFGEIDVISLLLEAKADIDTKDKSNETPLYKIIENFSNMLDNKPPSRNLTPEEQKKYEEYYEKIILLFIENGASLILKDKFPMSPLFKARENKKIKGLFREFLAEKAEIIDVSTKDHLGNSPLHNVEFIEEAEILIDRGADVNVKNSKKYFTPLHELCRKSIDSKGYYIEIIDFLLDMEAEINARDHIGNTPLHLSYQANSDLIDIFIDRGADINSKNQQGETVIKVFKEKSPNWIEFIYMLLVKGIEFDVNEKFRNKNTLLHEVILKQSKYIKCATDEYIELLIKKGADVNIQGKFEQTPMHDAVSAGLIDVVKILMQHGADITIKSKRGETPMDISKRLISDKSAGWGIQREILELFRKKKDEEIPWWKKIFKKN